MFDYLQKFNALPQNLRDSVSSPSAMAIISDLEKKYKIDLAALVMKVMVKSILLADLTSTFISDFSLDPDSAKKLTAELKERLFFSVSNYLGYIASYSSVMPKTAPLTSFSTVDRIVRDSGVSFPGADLNQRFKTILDTYVKGIRSRIDTRITLNKDIIAGGLGLNHQVIDKIFKIHDDFNKPASEEVVPAKNIKTGLEKIRALYEQPGNSRDIPYDLKSAISKGEIKKPVTPFNLPIPEESKEKRLEEPEEELLIAAPIKREMTVAKEENLVVTKAPIIESKPVTIPVKPASVVAPVAPIIKSEPVMTPIKPIVTPVPVVAPVHPITQEAPQLATQKIIKPAEKKPGFFSRLFGRAESTPKAMETVKSLPKTVPHPLTPPVSIAAKRMEAAANTSTTPSVPVKPPVAPRQAPRVMSPVDELRFLELINFRRLGATPNEAVSKIISKIKLLEKDGYDKMIGGITAWKQSPVNKIYLKMGQDALRNGQSLKEFAQKAQELKTPDVLTWEEIELIIKLNNKFMF
ncbi:MAG: hypothetical protein WAW11_00470 [Patescibacteria group bacterium]